MAGAVSPSSSVTTPGGPGAFSTRTDQNVGQPIRIPTGTAYGQAKQLEQAQRSVKLPQTTQNQMGNRRKPGPVPGPNIGLPARAPRGHTQGPVSKQSPDLLGMLSHPTQRPDEPLTAGMMPNQPTNTRQLLNMLAGQPGAPVAVKRLAAEANAR